MNLTAESVHAPLPELVVNPEVGMLWQNLLRLLTEHRPSLPRPELHWPELKILKKNRVRRWSSDTYFSPELNLTEEQRWQDVALDLATYFDEYVGLLKRKEYEYGLHGLIQNGQTYSRSVVDVCLSNETHMAEQGYKLTRAKLETWLAKVVALIQTDPGFGKTRSFVVFSPRGGEDERYPGIKAINYSFINVFYQGPTGWKFRQFTSFAKDENLAKLHQQIQAELGAEIFQPLPLPTAPATANHQLIATPLSLPKTKLDRLDSLVFADTSDWKVQLVELPELEGQEFETAKTEVTATLQTHFATLRANYTPAEASELFTTLVDGITRDHFHKWVEEHALNYRELRQKQRHRSKTKAVFSELTLADSITEEFRLFLAKRAGTATKLERKKLRALHQMMTLDPSLPLEKVASALHCTVGTPASIAKQAGESVGKVGKNVAELGGLLPESVRTLYQPLVLINDVTGEPVTWYIAREQYHLYVGKCYYQDGIPLGPCGVDLNLDDNVLSEAEYLARLEAEAVAARQRHLQDSLAANPQTSEVGLFTKELAQIEELITKLVYKESVSLGELLEGNVLKNPDELPPKLIEVGLRLQRAFNPIEELQTIITELELALSSQDSPNSLAPGIIEFYGGQFSSLEPNSGPHTHRVVEAAGLIPN